MRLHHREERHADISSGDLHISESEMSALGLVSFSREKSAYLLSGEHEPIIFWVMWNQDSKWLVGKWLVGVPLFNLLTEALFTGWNLTPQI